MCHSLNGDNPPMSHVLVVDDEPSIRQLVSTLLRLEGYEVETAPDGRAALQCVLDRPPAAVISDVRMPHMGGIELLTAIRANPAWDGIRFVILAARTDNNPATQAAIAQANACVTKPFTRAELLSALRGVAS